MAMELENTDGTWQQLITKKYLNNQTLSQASLGPGCSHFWQSLLGVNNIFQQFAVRKINNGAKTMFWEDVWVNDSPLALQFPGLSALTFTKMVTVKKVKDEGWEIFRFKRYQNFS